MTRLVIGAIFLSSFAYAAAGPDPLGAREFAIALVEKSGIEGARDAIRLMRGKGDRTAYQDAYIAELMRLIGDYEAPDFYGMAASADLEEPATEFLFGEYWRNFRGPLEPLFGSAEAHFAEAARRLACFHRDDTGGRYTHLREQLMRAVANLHERDGIPLLTWQTSDAGCSTNAAHPSLFLSTGIRGGELNADLDVVPDVSDLTSAALYSQSLRSYVPLSRGLLESFLRTVTPIENRNRLRLRYRGGRVDFFFDDRHSGNAAITDPRLRDTAFLSNRDLVLYNAFRLGEYGVSIARPFQLFHAADADVTVAYTRVGRKGLVDDNPDVREDVNQVEANAVISRFVGPDKANLQFTFVNQEITPDLPHAGTRDRQIYAGTFRYQVYRFGAGSYGRVFQGTRGIELYGGVLRDRENYGYDQPAVVDRANYFAGVTAHALRRIVDLSVQPTWFASNVPADPRRYNHQYRTAGYGLIRLVDEERYGPGLPPPWHGMRLDFIHLTVPFHYDSTQKNLADFGNYSAGAELSAKWFTTARGGITWLGSARYDVRRFITLDRTFSLFTLGVSMGF